jgi:hypothetical protein
MEPTDTKSICEEFREVLAYVANRDKINTYTAQEVLDWFDMLHSGDPAATATDAIPARATAVLRTTTAKRLAKGLEDGQEWAKASLKRIQEKAECGDVAATNLLAEMKRCGKPPDGKELLLHGGVISAAKKV